MIKLKHGVLIGLLASSINLMAQDPAAQTYGKLITESDLKENLTILASDAFEGRETGKRGQKIAAAFVRAHFEDIGLTGPVDGGYLQTVELYTSIPGEIYVKSGTSKFNNFEDVVYYGSTESNGEVTVSTVFVGKGRKEDFDQVIVEGKAVVVFVGKDENFRGPIGIAREKGAKIVFVVNPDPTGFTELLSQFKGFLSGGSLSVDNPKTKASKNSGTFFVSTAAAAKLMNTTLEKLTKAAGEDVKKAALKKMKPGTVTYKTSMDVKVLKSENVLGFLEGTDKKDEIVIVTSHYDHIGISKTGEGDRINNGADDDGSGTVSVMQIAKAFAQAKKDGKGPRRSILFMAVTGEEKGLLGSDYYTQHPIFPLDKTVVDLNIDMVGRRDPEHKDSAPYVYVIGSDKLSAELHTLSESVNKANNNLIFDYTYNSEGHPDRIYYRSDHWNFAKNGIPIIFYFDGIHEDYHKPSDEVSKIEFSLLANRAQTVFFAAWEIANREGRIVADKK